MRSDLRSKQALACAEHVLPKSRLEKRDQLAACPCSSTYWSRDQQLCRRHSWQHQSTACVQRWIIFESTGWKSRFTWEVINSVRQRIEFARIKKEMVANYRCSEMKEEQRLYFKIRTHDTTRHERASIFR